MMSSQNDIDSRVIDHSAHMIAHRIFTGKTSDQDHTPVESEIIAALRDTKIPDRDHQGQMPSSEHLLNILHATIAQTQAVLSPIPTISEDIRKNG